VERRRQEAIARQEAMVEDLRKAELVRDKLEGLDQSARVYRGVRTSSSTTRSAWSRWSLSTSTRMS
jgi:hypothetical protein